jgi:hypothetical protein
MHLSQAKWDNLTTLHISTTTDIFRQQQHRRQRVQPPQPGEVGPSDETKPQYTNRYIQTATKSGTQGAVTSVRRSGTSSPLSSFVQLLICLDFNNIGDRGCSHLSQAKWEHLNTLDLSTTTDMFRLQQHRGQRVQLPQPGEV